MIRIWLDNSYSRIPNGWIRVTSFEECIRLLRNRDVDAISLGNLQDTHFEGIICWELTEVDVAKWMIENGVFPKLINIHRNSPIRQLFEEAGIPHMYWTYEDNLDYLEFL